MFVKFAPRKFILFYIFNNRVFFKDAATCCDYVESVTNKVKSDYAAMVEW